MSTRGIVVVKDKNNRKIIEMYNQMDSYPEGMGQDLQNFIDSGKMVNGINLSETQRVFNGIDCFAAQLVAEMKDGAGGVYLNAPTKDYKNKKKYDEMYNAEYYYEINSDLKLKCWDTYKNKEINPTEVEE